MTSRVRLVVFLAVVVTHACADDPRASTDAGIGPDALGLDASADADAIAALPCDVLEDTWNTFVVEHRDCVRDEDCTVFFQQFEPGNICDAPAGLEVSINPDALMTAQRIAARVSSIECLPTSGWANLGFDGAPLRDPTCDRGHCSGNIPDCRNADAGQ